MNKLTKIASIVVVSCAVALTILVFKGAGKAGTYYSSNYSSYNNCGCCTDECASGELKCSSSTSYKICSEYYDGCWYWSTSRSCPSGTVCYNGRCVLPCTNECTSGAKRCASGQVETCGNYDSDNCTEWGGAQDCDSGKACAGNGECICISHAKKQCDGTNLYWYDSCNNKQELDQDCGSDFLTDNYRCSSDWIQREKIKKGCLNQQCYETSEWVNQTDCAAESKKCDGGQCVLICSNECTANVKRCANGQVETCSDHDADSCTEWGGATSCPLNKICVEGECKCTDHALKQCDGNSLYWYDSCGTKQELAQDCGSDSLTDNYDCYGEWIRREKIKKGCLNQQCYETSEWVNQTDCAAESKKCDGGQCVITCANQCASGAKRCASGKVETCNDYNADSCTEWGNAASCSSGYTCSGNGECVSTCTDECIANAKRCANGKVETCNNYDADSCTEWGGATSCPTNKTCVNGECGCTSHESKKCYNNDLYWYDSCGLKEDLAQNCGNDEWTDNYGCSGNWTKREKIKRGCSSNQCYVNYEWINEYDCSDDNKECDDGDCITTCTNQCASGAKRCASGKVETCGYYDSDSCREWGNATSCPTNKTCVNGECGCTSHASKQCDGTNLYWYDSCGNKQELAQNCGSYLCSKETDVCNTGSQKATLIVKKTMIGGTSSFTFNGMLSGTISTNNGTISTTVEPGTFKVVEVAKDGWTLNSIVCSDSDSFGNIGIRTATFVASAGETITCTFTNTATNSQKATLIVKKTMIGGTSSFTFNGMLSGTISTNNGTISTTVEPGTFKVVEVAKDGWTLNSIVCSDSDSFGNIGIRTATFVASAGETITCTFTNTLPPKILGIIERASYVSTSSSGIFGEIFNLIYKVFHPFFLEII